MSDEKQTVIGPDHHLDTHGTVPRFWSRGHNDYHFDKAGYEGGVLEYIFGYSSPLNLAEPYRSAAILLLDIVDTYEDWELAQEDADEEGVDESCDDLFGSDDDA